MLNLRTMTSCSFRPEIAVGDMGSHLNYKVLTRHAVEVACEKQKKMLFSETNRFF